MKKWYSVMALGIVMLSVIALRGVSGTDAVLQHTSGRLKPQSDPVVYDLDVRQAYVDGWRGRLIEQERFTGVSLRLRIALDAGSVTWRLTDPRGEVRWQGRVRAGEELRESRDVPPVEGTWTLEVVPTQARGDYDLLWEGREQ